MFALLLVQAGLSDNDLWKWLFGIVGALAAGGLLAILGGIRSQLSSLNDKLAKGAVEAGRVDQRVETLEAKAEGCVDRDALERTDREIGRGLASLKDDVARVHMRLDTLLGELLRDIAKAMHRQADATEALARVLDVDKRHRGGGA